MGEHLNSVNYQPETGNNVQKREKKLMVSIIDESQIIRLAHDEIYGIMSPFLAHMLHKKSTSYQRRPGRLSSAQKQAMHDSEFLITSTDSKAIDCIIGRYDQCTVEIGFGMGDHLLLSLIHI